MRPSSSSNECLEPPTASLLPAPRCQRDASAVRLYEHSCRCVRGVTALDTDITGQPRGNCTGLEDNTEDNLDKVWCFLENIRDPLDPSAGCYSDVRWSDKDGRFWSSAACFQVTQLTCSRRQYLLLAGPGH